MNVLGSHTKRCPFPWLNSTTLRCSVCGEQELHLGEVVVDQLGVVVRIDRIGPHVEGHDCDLRGSVVRIRLVCEYGHLSWLQLAFHKGAIYAGVDVEGEYSVPDEFPSTLARD